MNKNKMNSIQILLRFWDFHVKLYDFCAVRNCDRKILLNKLLKNYLTIVCFLLDFFNSWGVFIFSCFLFLLENRNSYIFQIVSLGKLKNIKSCQIHKKTFFFFSKNSIC